MGFSFNSIFFQFLFLVFGVLFINGIQDHIACVDAMVSDIQSASSAPREFPSAFKPTSCCHVCQPNISS